MDEVEWLLCIVCKIYLHFHCCMIVLSNDSAELGSVAGGIFEACRKTDSSSRIVIITCSYTKCLNVIV